MANADMPANRGLLQHAAKIFELAYRTANLKLPVTV
jgi:hypothetical protein